MCLSISYISLKLILPLGNRNKTKTKGNVHGRERKRRRKGGNQKRRDQEGDGEVGEEENRTEQKEGYWPGRKEQLGKLGCRKMDDRSFVGKGRGLC